MKVLDWGTCEYQEAWDRQLSLADEVIGGDEDTLVFVEHDPVLTLGANFHETNLKLTRDQYTTQGITLHKNDRGGDVTFHGPGQLVIYPIFDLTRHGKDLHKWLRDLEETMILTSWAFDLNARRFPPHTGVWIEDRKLAAIGIKIKRWVSVHGIALNCNNSLDAFETIIPCGIDGYSVTNLSKECQRDITTDEAKAVVIKAFQRVFG